jgi:hypothetical protein
MINIGIGIGWAKALYSVANNVIANFKARVLSYPNSIFEAGPCLDATLEELNAIGLLDNASLVITPNAYTEGILYDVVPNTTLGDMTVVRATTATRINSAGLVEVVPRNLFTNSNDFANASWNKQNTSITANSIISPDGTQNASKFIANSTNAFHAIYSGAGAYYGDNTFSVYAKKGEYNFLILQDQFSSAFYNTFNIDSGTILGGTNGTITSVGNGWYRCSVKFTAPAGNVFPTITIAPTSGGASYLGNSTSGAYLYGAQIEQGITATEYFPTTTRLNIPRIDYTNGSCPSLLVEPQRTNLLTYSEQFNNAAWTANGITITANNTTSPDGTQSADRALETATNAYHDILYLNATLSAGTTYTLSCFVKYAGREFIYLFVSNGIAAAAVKFNIQTGVVLGTALGSVVSSKIENYGNGWYRCSVVYTSAILATATLAVSTTNSGALSLAPYAGDITKGIYVWGAQLEAGSYGTSYIPTVASTVTRNADVISKTGIGSIFGSSYTIYGDFINQNINITRLLSLKITSGGNYDNFITIYQNGTALTATGNNASSAEQFAITSGDFSLNQRLKFALKCQNNNVAFYINGTQIGVDTSCTIPAVTAIYVGNYVDVNGVSVINSVSVFNSALTNTELAQLTTL